MSGTEFDVKGESIDEERNEEEGARQEEEEVARAASLVYSSTNRPRAIGADSILAAAFWAPREADSAAIVAGTATIDRKRTSEGRTYDHTDE
jgi:hypothetical protein